MRARTYYDIYAEKSIIMTTIAVLVGSLRKESFNLALAKGIASLAPEGVNFVYADMDLPLFNQDLEAAFPAKAVAI